MQKTPQQRFDQSEESSLPQDSGDSRISEPSIDQVVGSQDNETFIFNQDSERLTIVPLDSAMIDALYD